MGAGIVPSAIRGVHFAHHNVTETMREVWDEAGVTYHGRVPPGVKVGHPLVVHPREGETWWLSVRGTEEDLKAGRVVAHLSLIRVQSEVDHLQRETEKALKAFVAREFPGARVSSRLDLPPLRGVTVEVTGPTRECHYGSGGKMSKGWKNHVLGALPQDRDDEHPYVSTIKVTTEPDSVLGSSRYVFRAGII